MMHRLIEFLLGLDKGFLDKQGDLHLVFNPHWPLQRTLGAGTWNFALVLGILAVVIHCYRQEGRSLPVRAALGTVRGLLLGFVLLLLNNPVLSLVSSRTEPSVVAVLIDTSTSMRVHDAGTSSGGANGIAPTRLEAVIDLLTADHQAFLRDLGRKHILRIYRFDGDKHAVADIATRRQGEREQSEHGSDDSVTSSKESDKAVDAYATASDELKKLTPTGTSTQVIRALRGVLDDLQGQRLAGVVVMTDGRDTPAEQLADVMPVLKNYGVKIIAVPVGSDKPPQNIQIQTVNVQDAVFKDDVVNLKTVIRATGYEKGHAVRLVLKDAKTGALLKGPEDGLVEKTIHLDSDKPQEVELPFKAENIGTMDITVEAERQSGEVDDEDNIRTTQVAVLDAHINVLYVEGPPRWEYRYIKTDMIRSKTVNISCILTSADPTFIQEASHPEGFKYFPYKRFPETMEQLMETDVIVFGDFDPKLLSDAQLQMVSDFVSKNRGGFEMIAGPKFSPQAWRNSTVENLLPVSVAKVETTVGNIAQGYRPALTLDGAESNIFRFFTDKEQNSKYLKDDLQPLFWYCRGVQVKQGLGQVYAQHPTELGPDGQPAPLLVVGQFGGGRTMFSAMEETWRWRFYTGESIFTSFWTQQMRYLARGKKLGQRRVVFASQQPAYELGRTASLSLRMLDSKLVAELPDQLGVDIINGDDQVVRHEMMVRQAGQKDLFVGTFTADHMGKFRARLNSMADMSGSDLPDLPFEVMVPQLELNEPQADRAMLSRLASETLGAVVELPEAREKLPPLLVSAAKSIAEPNNGPLWDAPLALAIFVLLITVEWVLRKVYGML